MRNFLRFALLPLLFIISGCGGNKDDALFFDGKTFDEATIGVMMGSTQDKYIEENYPNADIIRMDQMNDLYLALKNHKCDLIVVDAVSHQVNYGNDKSLSILIPELFTEDFGVGFSYADPSLKNAFNTFLLATRKSGLYDEIARRWIDSLDTARMPDLSSVKRTGKPIKVGCTGSSQPFDFVGHGRNAGLDIELMERFAASLQRPIEYSIINFGGLIAALSSGMVDAITASITITPERLKSVNFADSHYESASCVVIRSENMPKGFTSVDDPSIKSIGVLLGSAQDIHFSKLYGDKVVKIPDNSNLLLAVSTGRADVGVISEPEAKAAILNNKHITILQSNLFATEFGVAFNKNNNTLPSQFNDFLEKYKRDGLYDELCQRWSAGASLKEVPYQDFKRSGQLPLKVGTTGTTVPFSFIKDGKPSGFDIELITRFAASLGREVEFSIMNFDSLIPSVSSGKIDVAINSIMITEERAKEVNFTKSYYEVQTSAVVLKTRMAPKIIKSAGAFRIPDGDGTDISTALSGVMTGSLGEMFIKENYPEAKVLCFDEITDAIQALRTGRVKYVMTAYTNAVNACRTDKKLVILPDQYTHEGAAVAVNKQREDELAGSINKSIKKMKSDGTLDDVIERWIRMDGEYEEVSIPERKNAPVLKVGISASREPMCFIRNGKPAGLDIELVKRVAYDMGRSVEFFDMKFSALTAALLSDKVDVVASNFTATPERAKVVAFSEEYYTNPQILMTMSQSAAEEVDKASVFTKIKESFINNLVVEKRYKLILDGLWQTVIISVFAILLGTLLGAGICFLRMSKLKVLSVFAKGYIDIMRGTPVLVLLMIVFYVIFAKSNISATSVAVLTFAMNFAAYVSEMFRSSIEGIDRGQKEAGIALGFTPTKTFRYVILPQAVARVMPVYKGEAISLVKMTSVVGYIAVQDLTKASDIIRSRTFDAFFPLIVITIIYFILAWLLGKGLDLLNKKKTVKE